MTLRPLSGEAVAGLVAETVAAEPGPMLLTEIAGAGGNPLFVTELLGALAQEDAIEIRGGRADVAQAILPPTLRLTILRRLSFLPEQTLRTLRAASILGSAFSLTDLAAITSQSAVELSEMLAEAITARILADDGAVLRFRHDLIRESIYADLPGSLRRGLHREAGQRLAHQGAPALQVAEHFARGATQGDAEAISWLTRAAREAAARSPDVAAELLERAAGLMDPADPGRDELLAERASSLMLAGRIAETVTACCSTAITIRRWKARSGSASAMLSWPGGGAARPCGRWNARASHRDSPQPDGPPHRPGRASAACGWETSTAPPPERSTPGPRRPPPGTT
jgi:predicted ATPase